MGSPWLKVRSSRLASRSACAWWRSDMGMPDPVYLVAILVLLSLAPFVAIMVTSFVKLVVVLSLVRNAMGVQQTPPNMVINGLAVILTVYIMAPVAQDAFDILQAKKPDLKNIESVKESVIACMEPLKKFLVKHTHMKERKFFVETA